MTERILVAWRKGFGGRYEFSGVGGADEGHEVVGECSPMSYIKFGG